MEIQDIPFAAISRGESSLLLDAVLREKESKILRKKRLTREANLKMQEAKLLQNVFNSGLHTPQAYNNLSQAGNNSELNNLINVAKSDIAPALNIHSGMITQTARGLSLNPVQFNPNPSIFDVTPEQVEECTKRYDRIYGMQSSRAKSIAIRNCIARLPFENIIKFHVAKSGGVLLYNTIKERNTSYNQEIQIKDNRQAEWVRSAAITTGIGQSSVIKVLKASVMDFWGETPDNVYANLSPYMTQPGVQGSLNIDPNTKTPDIILPQLEKPNNGGLIKTGDPLADLIISVALVLVDLFFQFKNRQSELEKIDTAIRETSSVPKDIIWSCVDFNGLTVDCDSGEVAAKICRDAITGEVVPCPENEGNNTLAYLGIGAALLGGVFLVTRNRNNPQKKDRNEQ